jgi:hypothetical protein
MKKKIDPFEGIFAGLQDKTLPTDEQKKKMLNYILTESRPEKVTLWEKAGEWITVYPWRFAFSAAAMQAAVFTLIFGAEYTNLILKIIGG